MSTLFSAASIPAPREGRDSGGFIPYGLNQRALLFPHHGPVRVYLGLEFLEPRGQECLKRLPGILDGEVRAVPPHGARGLKLAKRQRNGPPGQRGPLVYLIKARLTLSDR